MQIILLIGFVMSFGMSCYCVNKGDWGISALFMSQAILYLMLSDKAKDWI